MPITIPPISRRRFLRSSVATSAGLFLSPALLHAIDGAPPADPDRLALLSDVHIAADPTAHEKGVTMYDHLRSVRDQVLALSPKPAFVLINGDCAHHLGLSEDYRTLVGLLEPLRRADLPIHLMMGNHDNREHLWAEIPGSAHHVDPLPHRQVEIICHPRANLFLLDSLDKTNSTPGVLGPKQLEWLGHALDTDRDKPAIVFVHHNPDSSAKTNGLTDTAALMDMLLPRRHVKALFFGHTHVWSHEQREGLHLVNLPAVAYVFNPDQPSGWVDAHLADAGMTLQLLCLDETDPRHRQKVEMEWRQQGC